MQRPSSITHIRAPSLYRLRALQHDIPCITAIVCKIQLSSRSACPNIPQSHCKVHHQVSSSIASSPLAYSAVFISSHLLHLISPAELHGKSASLKNKHQSQISALTTATYQYYVYLNLMHKIPRTSYMGDHDCRHVTSVISVVDSRPHPSRLDPLKHTR